MESIVQMGNEKVRLKANAFTAHHYKNHFKSDILKDTLNALGGVSAIMELQNLEKASDYKKLEMMIDKFDTVIIQQLVWSFAKTDDRKLIPFYEWLEKVDFPPISDIISEDGFVELLVGNITRKK